MEGSRFAKVAVAAATYAMDKPYDYLLPPSLRETAAPGMRVLVPFGRSNKKTEAVILSVCEDSQLKTPKAVARLLDDAPLLDDKAIKLALWMRERFFCTVFEAVRAMLPAGLWNSFERMILLKDEALAHQMLADPENDTASKQLLETLLKRKKGLSISAAAKLTAPEPPDALVKRLEETGVLYTETQIGQAVNDKTVKIIRLAVSAEEAGEYAQRAAKTAPMQAAALEQLAQCAQLSAKELCYMTGATTQTIASLEKKGLVESIQKQVYRRPVFSKTDVQAGPITLNDEQGQSYRGISELLSQSGPHAALLHGVTGSGKTQVYIKLIQDVLSSGGQAIVLVPEIALTPQLMEIFWAHFGQRVAVLHSALSQGERSDEWQRIHRGQVGVVVGTRSAVFAPLENIRLIVIDEEQEYSYKSENSPRYHARDIAKFRCVQHGAVLLLGSATPSVESMYSARSGAYSLFTINERYNRLDLPRVELADMRAELKNGNASTISALLYHELEKNIKDQKQSILFINRRGNSRLVACVECGYIPYCPRCSVALSYHSVNGRLMCHYCGYSEKVSERCPDCSGELKHVGAGTQKVVQELGALFPGVEILRMDTDVTSTRNSHEQLLDRFRYEKIPILVGTQMVAKGLDFENVTLVGVLAADISLYVDDFRACERTFSLITQVIGRAGRGESEGRAVIQTFTPQNPVILFAASQDYNGFYENEIGLRRAHQIPPFSDLFVLTVFGSAETSVLEACTRLRAAAENCLTQLRDLDVRILGPAPAPVTKLNNRFRYRLTLCCRNNRSARSLVSRLLTYFHSDKRNKNLHVFADINPE